MIILDTNTLWGLTPEHSSTDLLRAVRAAAEVPVAVPWMVLEELVAQRAAEYQEGYERAAGAVAGLRRVTPWVPGATAGPCETAAVRQHWQQQWRKTVGVIPTSERALREAAVREANALRPCRTVKGMKVGGRDAAVWLSAVQWAERHPGENVYFVTGNTRDFGDGQAFPAPMDQDVAALGGRFRLLTSLAEVVAEFATPCTADDTLMRALLTSATTARELYWAARFRDTPAGGSAFACTISGGPGREPAVVPADVWISTGARLTVTGIEEMRTYRIGKIPDQAQVWCTATVHCTVRTMILTDDGPVWGAFSLTASIAVTPAAIHPPLTLLRADTPQPLSPDDFRALPLPTPDMIADQETARRWYRVTGEAAHPEHDAPPEPRAGEERRPVRG
ncbi:PIN domain-containing protein [Streptomyces uncialis]|uniref:PIN domain-containing protein n=1 Tax=Streptomyces uncialis TaxID=1048205 RepID=UPI00382C1624